MYCKLPACIIIVWSLPGKQCHMFRSELCLKWSICVLFVMHMLSSLEPTTSDYTTTASKVTTATTSKIVTSANATLFCQCVVYICNYCLRVHTYIIVWSSSIQLYMCEHAGSLSPGKLCHMFRSELCLKWSICVLFIMHMLSSLEPTTSDYTTTASKVTTAITSKIVTSDNATLFCQCVVCIVRRVLSILIPLWLCCEHLCAILK